MTIERAVALNIVSLAGQIRTFVCEHLLPSEDPHGDIVVSSWSCNTPARPSPWRSDGGAWF